MIPKATLALLEEIKKSNKKLTKPEEGFLATVSITAKQNRLITERQGKWLEIIYRKCSDGGQYAERQFIR